MSKLEEEQKFLRTISLFEGLPLVATPITLKQITFECGVCSRFSPLLASIEGGFYSTGHKGYCSVPTDINEARNSIINAACSQCNELFQSNKAWKVSKINGVSTLMAFFTSAHCKHWPQAAHPFEVSGRASSLWRWNMEKGTLVYQKAL